jgi:mRNA-degrading endonuclease toxin of MazEF toxin-antitoxin module
VTTSPKQALRGPTVVVLDAATTGLNPGSAILGHQITTLDRSQLLRLLGTLPPHWMARLDEAMRAPLQLD